MNEAFSYWLSGLADGEGHFGARPTVRHGGGQGADSPGLVARRRLPLFEASVAGMCQSCEPLGYCRTADCPLRPVSPLPLGRIREANGRRWSRPGERERQSERLRAAWERRRAAS